MTTTPPIRDATPEDTDQIVEILTAGLDSGELADWLMPPSPDRTRRFREYFTMITEHALHGAGQVQLVDSVGAFLWYPTTSAPPNVVPANYDQRLIHIAGPYLNRCHQLGDVMKLGYLPQPHLHLGFAAVTPAAQGRGVCSSALAASNAKCDRTGQTASLIATSPAGAALCRRRGYRHTPGLYLPDGGPPLWPMIRTPALPSAALSGQRVNGHAHHPTPTT